MTGFLLINTQIPIFFRLRRASIWHYNPSLPSKSSICGAIIIQSHVTYVLFLQNIFFTNNLPAPEEYVNIFCYLIHFKSNASWTFKIPFCEAYWVQISLAKYTDSVFKLQRSGHNDKCVEVTNQTFQIPHFSLNFARFKTAKCEFSYVLRGLEVLKQL